MKLFRFGEVGRERPGAIDRDGKRRDLSGVIDDLGGEALSPGSLARLNAVDLSTLPVVGDDVRLGPCIARPGHFLAIGLNYADHASESKMELPKEPIVFTKAPSCIVGPDDDIVVPQGSQRTDWEAELAVVIGTRAYRVSEAEAPGVIAGYCVCNDVSERQYQTERGGQWVKGKSSPTFGPLGPWLVTADEVADAQNLGIWLKLNGETVQKASTAHMIFGIYKLIAHLSEFMILEPGDVITTGTPSGVGMAMQPPRFLKAGDLLELGVEGLGVQHQRVAAG